MVIAVNAQMPPASANVIRADVDGSENMWTNAITVDVCKECGDDVLPGDVLLRTFYHEPSGSPPLMRNYRVTLCKGCGELFQESLEFGRDEEITGTLG